MADLDGQRERDDDAHSRNVDTDHETAYRARVNYIPFRAALAFYVGISLAVICLFWWQGRIIQQQCIDGKVNRTAIRNSVIDGLAPLGAKYDPETQLVVPAGQPIDYYKTHWEERQAALRTAIRTLARFPAIECTGGGYPWQ